MIETSPTAWDDKVYLSADDILDSGDVLLGSLRHIGTLHTQASYSALLTPDLPDGIQGTYYVFVKTDAGGFGAAGEVAPRVQHQVLHAKELFVAR